LVQKYEANDLEDLSGRLLDYALWLDDADEDLHWASCDWNEAIVQELTKHVRTVAEAANLVALDEEVVNAMFWQMIRRGQYSWKEAVPRFDLELERTETLAEALVRADRVRDTRKHKNYIRRKKEKKFDERMEALEWLLENPATPENNLEELRELRDILQTAGRDGQSSDEEWYVGQAKVGLQRTVSRWRRRQVTYIADKWEAAVQYCRPRGTDPRARRSPRQPIAQYKDRPPFERVPSHHSTPAPDGLPSNFYHTKQLMSWGQKVQEQMKIREPEFVSIISIEPDADTDNEFICEAEM
jgi:hypothetical protein